MTERDKQIAEMAKLACSVFDGNCTDCSFAIYHPPCPPKASAERLYNAGYRKQVKGEWVEIEFTVHCEDDVGVCYRCSECEGYNDSEVNFCPNCGAKMKGGGST